MKRLAAVYDGFLTVLAAVSALAFGAVSFFVAYEVMVRWLGEQGLDKAASEETGCAGD